MERTWSEPPRTPLWGVVKWYSKRKFGTVLAPARVMAHQPRVLKAYLDYERGAQKWGRVDPALKHLAVMAAAATVGCSWCMDFSYWASGDRGVPPEKARALPRWREAECFSELERLVIEYAEKMSSTPVMVDEALSERLSQHLDDAQLVELTAAIALENLRSRTNRAFGLTSQGFSDRCQVRPVREGQPA
ncbi:MAG: carboxymuconolactone decarboxylase family protein [Actinomycetota bacterium]|nr:carboxymuconolactone decarboxylase family protein [Actinomycetota bacterium]